MEIGCGGEKIYPATFVRLTGKVSTLVLKRDDTRLEIQATHLY
jgi:hypothetical protein